MARTKRSKPGYHRHAAEQAAAASNHRGSSKGTPLPTNADTNDTAGVQDVLGPKHDTGVSKKKKKQKPMKRQQRLRKEKGVERAEAVMDQLENKINKSKSRGKTVKNRRAAWEDLNGGVQRQKSRKAKEEKTGTQHQDVTMQEAQEHGEDMATGSPNAAPEIQVPDADSEMPGQAFLDAAGNADDLHGIS